MNTISLIGRLTAEPELKYTQSGKAFTRFTLAINRPYDKEKTDFINCQAWEKKAELIAEYVRKGNRLAINGRLQVDPVGEGQERKIYYNVIVNEIEFLENNKKDNVNVEKEKVETIEDYEDSFPF